MTRVPATWLVVCTITAGLEKYEPQSKHGISHALKYGDAIAAGEFLAPAKTLSDGSCSTTTSMHRLQLCPCWWSLRPYRLISIRKALGNPRPTAMEMGSPEQPWEVAVPDPELVRRGCSQ